MAAEPKNEWPLGFFDCFSYRDLDGNRPFFPDFCPKAVLGTCFPVGEYYSISRNEDPVFCNMGMAGLGCCIISIPINIAGPAGGFFWFALHSMNMRRETIAKFNIDEKVSCLCCDFPTWLIGICYPCNMFQVIMTHRHFKRKQTQSPKNSLLMT